MDICSGERRPVEREPGHSYSKPEFFRRELPADVIAELLAHFADGRRQREARVLDFTPWAGAYNCVPAEATAFAHRAERFMLKQEVVVGAGASEAERQAARDWLLRSWALVHPWGSGGVYTNFPDPELDDWGRAYRGNWSQPTAAVWARVTGFVALRICERLPPVATARLFLKQAPPSVVR